MFIALDANANSAPFEGAEPNLRGTHLVSFRPFERRVVLNGTSVYKHLTPNGVKTATE